MEQQTMDMAIRLVDDKVKFVTEAQGLAPLDIDAHPPLGYGGSYTPLDLLLASVASCLGITLASLLRGRMRRDVRDLRITAHGTLRDVHPKGFTQIELRAVVVSPDVTEAEMDRAIDSAENKICPVVAMVKGAVEVSVSYVIERP